MKALFSISIAIAIAAILAGCETPPTVTQQPNVAAVRQQNVQTQQHIQKTRTHIQKSQESEKRADDHLNAVSSDIDRLLNMPATVEPTPIPKATPNGATIAPKRP